MKKFIALSLSLLTLAACESTKQTSPKDNAAFWQRSEMTSALYLRGPKAQHQLHMDIASCVSEVKELSRLGTIRDANPPAGIEMNVGLAKNWQSPKGNGPLYTEYRDFHDFESCMNFKGWERTNYVGDETIDNATANYNTVILGKPVGQNQKAQPTYRSNRDSASGSFNN